MTLLAYVSGDWGWVHSWFGYALLMLVLLRLAWATTGVRQLGLMRFYPLFAGLRLGTALTHPAISRTLLCGIAAALIGSLATGLAMDRGKAIGLAAQPVAASAHASYRGAGESHTMLERHETANHARAKGLIVEAHEAFANILLLLVILHASYVSMFKWPLARFMLFIGANTDRPRDSGTMD